MLTLFREQPRPFYMIFMLEIWERFGFYTVQGILVLYFIRLLGFSYDVAYHTFGVFFALVYGMVALGGYLGDKVLGTKRTIVLGLVVLALGYLALALVDHAHVFWALGLICVGNGLFKANPSSLLAKCYDKRDPGLHAGFTLYYMAINLGAIAALFVGPTVSSHYGYSYAYFISFIGILLGLVNYWFQRQSIASINTPADLRIMPYWGWGCIIAGVVLAVTLSAYLLQQIMIAKQLLIFITLVLVAMYFSSLVREKTSAARMRMLLAFILMVEAVAFFTLYQQMPTSINLFAVNNVHSHLLGISLDPQSFQVFNPIWIICMSPVMAMLYGYLDRAQITFRIPYKFAMGMTCCGLSFLVLYLSRYTHDAQGLVSPWWLVGSYFFQSLGELLVSALGVAMVAELVPTPIVGFVMGMWYLTSSVAGFTGAAVASYTDLPHNMPSGIESLMVYTHVFLCIGLSALGVALLLWVVSPRLSRLMGEG